MVGQNKSRSVICQIPASLADHSNTGTSYFNSMYLELVSSINRAIHASVSGGLGFFPLSFYPVTLRVTNEKILLLFITAAQSTEGLTSTAL